MQRKKLGQLLCEASLIGEDDLLRALEVQERTGEKVGSILMQLGLVKPEMLARVLAEQFQVDGVDPSEESPTAAALELVPEELAFDLGCLPLSVADGELTVALADPTDPATVRRLEQATSHRIRSVVAPQTALFKALKRHYGGGPSSTQIDQIRSHLAEIKRLVAAVEQLLPEEDDVKP